MPHLRGRCFRGSRLLGARHHVERELWLGLETTLGRNASLPLALFVIDPGTREVELEVLLQPEFGRSVQVVRHAAPIMAALSSLASSAEKLAEVEARNRRQKPARLSRLRGCSTGSK